MKISKIQKELLIETSRLHWLLPTSTKIDVIDNFKLKINKLGNFNNLEEFLFLHKINNLFSYYIKQYLPNIKLPSIFSDALEDTSLLNSILLLELESILKALPSDIKVIPLKGISFINQKNLYPEINLRIMDDIDILVEKKDISRVKDVLIRHNYYIPEIYKDYHKEHFHYVFKKNINDFIITLELHFELSTNPRFKINTERIINNSKPLFDNMPNLYFLSPEDTLYYALFHTGFHYIFERLQWLGEVEGLFNYYADLDLNTILNIAKTENTYNIISNTITALVSLYNINLNTDVLENIENVRNDFLLDESRIWDKNKLRNRFFQVRYGLKTIDHLKEKLLWSKKYILNKIKRS